MKAGFQFGIALVLIALPASAQTQTPPRRPTLDEKFLAANVSGSGCLTYQEAHAGRMTGVVKEFAAIDIAHQGCVTLPEIKAYRHGTRNLSGE